MATTSLVQSKQAKKGCAQLALNFRQLLFSLVVCQGGIKDGGKINRVRQTNEMIEITL